MNDPGTEADAIGWEYDDDEIDIPPHGIHITAVGERLEIKNMKTSHLKNSIRYGTYKHDGSRQEYWDYVIPQFQAELAKRKDQ